MASFFIDRPIFAAVIALFICLGGLLALPFLAIAQYPIIAPPSISISTSYPGASPENLYNSVTRLIEEELNGASGILSFESTSDSLGQVEITANFVPGTDSSLASVEVQNRIKRVEARLPRAVIQQGILIEEASSAVLQIITLRSTDGKLDDIGLGDFMIRNVLGEIRRIPGVGRATLFSSERSLRVWLDADKLVGYQLTSDDVTKAIEAQNAQVASGSLGAEPSRKSQPVSALVLVKGQLATPEEFGAIVLRANPDGSTVRLRDVARIEVGGMGYQFTTRLNGQPSAGLTVLLAPTGNALATANAVQAKMEELSKFFPSNIKYEIPYDITPVVEASIKKVIITLIEAVILVFLVMLLFLQNIRYTLIPTIVVPVALLGTCATLLMMGLSINMLTLFAMVLAIGILVDDAIVVVENVERIMSEEGLPPREATRKAMTQITSAIIGITLVLVAVFIPMAFFPGSVGVIYRQFSITMVSAIAFSAFLALSLTPALCATLLKPVAAGHQHARRGLFGLFNRGMDKTKAGYSGVVRWTLLRTGRLMLVYLAIVIALGWAFMRLPAGFLPVDDQGFITADVQTPPEASFNRTLDAVKRVEEFLAQRNGVDNVTFLTGFSFLGQGQNTAQAFVTLKDWSERGPNDSAQAIVADINKSLGGERQRCQDLGIAAAADRQSREFERLQLPSAGPGAEGICRADAREGSAPYRREKEPDPAGRLCRGTGAGAAGRTDRRPREGRGARRDLPGRQQHHFDQSGLGLHQRLSQPRPHAARDRAGRQFRPHADRRHPHVQRAQQQRQPGAAVVLCHDPLDRRPDADGGLQLLSGGENQRLGQAGLYQRRRDRRDGAHCRNAAARVRL